MLYSYDALGLGHVRRMMAIARSGLDVAPWVSALLVTCSPQISALPAPKGLDWIKLPSARKVGRGVYTSRTLDLDRDEFHGIRTRMLTEIARGFRPDFLLVDKAPLGLMGELSETLERLRGSGSKPRVVLGWRDILDHPDRVREEWEANGWLEAIERHYDEVWVFGDPAVFDVRIEYPLPHAIRSRIRYLGYLSPSVGERERSQMRERLMPNGERLAVVTTGGGEDGEPLLTAWMEAAVSGRLPRDLHSIVVAGPFLPPEAMARLRESAPPRVTVVPFLPGLETAIAAADVVVSMAGYNTVCEVLGAGVRSVLVPRTTPREEQKIRATRLERLHRARVVAAQELSGAAIARAVTASLEDPAPIVPMRLDGLEQVGRSVRRTLVPAIPGRNGERGSNERPMRRAAT